MIDKIILNDYFREDIDILHENNLKKTLNLVNEIRLLYPQKTIWLYTGYKAVSVDSEYGRIIFDRDNENFLALFSFKSTIAHNKRTEVASMCDVIIDGQYIDSQRDITLPYRGSKNQRVIDIKGSLIKGEIVLYK